MPHCWKSHVTAHGIEAYDIHVLNNTGSSGPSLLDNAISTKISCAGSIRQEVVPLILSSKSVFAYIYSLKINTDLLANKYKGRVLHEK